MSPSAASCPPPPPRRLTRLGVALLATLAMGGIAQADLLIYESFDYTPGSTIDGKDGGQGFTTPWQDIAEPQDADLVQSGSLSYGSLQTSANSLLSLSVAAGGSTLTRQFSPVPGTPGTTTWISFLLSATSSTPLGSSDYAFLGMKPGTGTNNAPQFGVFDGPGGHVFGISVNQGSDTPTLSEVPFVLGQSYLLVASIEWFGDGAPETVKLYVNPPLDGSPLVAAATRSNIEIIRSGVSQLQRLQFETSGNGAQWGLDELRIGETFADVTPVPEPSTTAIFAMGLVFAALFLRHRSTLKRRGAV